MRSLLKPSASIVAYLRFLVLLVALAVTACGGGATPDMVDGRPGDGDGGANGDGGPGSDGGGGDAGVECADPPPPPAECDYFTQCGCADIGKCSASNMGRVCREAGALPAGEICTADTECVAGSLCTNFGGERRCLRYCDDAHGCPGEPDMAACFIGVLDNMSNTIATVCGQVCSLLAQDCLGPTLGCYPSVLLAPIAERGICVSSGMSAAGAACMRSNECAEGLACVDVAGGATTCARLCDRMAVDPGCADMQTCGALTGHTQTGVCR